MTDTTEQTDHQQTLERVFELASGLRAWHANWCGVDFGDTCQCGLSQLLAAVKAQPVLTPVQEMLDRIYIALGTPTGDGAVKRLGELVAAEARVAELEQVSAALSKLVEKLEAEAETATERLKQSEASTVKAAALDKFADHCRARNEGLAETDRLDWLEKQMKTARQWPTYDPVSMDPQCEWAFFAPENGKHGMTPYDTLRAAIDAARATESGEVPRG